MDNNNNNKTTVVRKVQFYPRVKTRRVAVPITDKDMETWWYTVDELNVRKRKDKKLRVALARDPSIYDSDCLCRIGLYTEKDRRIRYSRAKEARFAIFLEQTGNGSVSSSCDDADSAMMAESYSHYSEIASHIAYKRGLEQARHVEALWSQPPSSTLMMEPDPNIFGPCLATVHEAVPTQSERFQQRRQGMTLLDC